MLLKLEANSTIHGIKDVPADVFIKAYAKHLKDSGQFEVPKWMEYAKTSCAKELGPYDPDFLYIRAASLIRHLAFRADAGVGRFRKIYGSSQDRGGAPAHHRKASGKIIRHCLQQFEKMKLLERKDCFRVLSSMGQSSIDQVARHCV